MNTAFRRLSGFEIARCRDFVRNWMRRWDGRRSAIARIHAQPRLNAAAFGRWADKVMPPALTRVRILEIEIVLTHPPRGASPAAPRAAGVNLMAALLDYCEADVRAARDMALRMPMRPTVLDVVEAVPARAAERRDHRSFWANGDEFGGRLADRGYRVIGSGAFSTVYHKPGSDRVIKVNRRPDNWLDYVVWAARAGHAGKLAPKVYSFRVFNEGTPDAFYVAVMERLETTVSRAECTKPDAYRAWMSMRQFIEQQDAAAGVEAELHTAGAIRFGVAFRAAFKRAWDLHGGNFMLRADGSLVCTDPLCEEGTSSPPYSRMRQRELESLAQIPANY
ncbi:hypothetical protein HL667_06195 [Bradyrhizobium sp. 83012]|uniref:Uncharacterized protein n=1 Tax=Bradyrhizobium aeschynomenes TaxID=2734909 RepID=A0ABX2C965_9BRAD|nr:hypothetical protein [Bradyrhizobium aeschynomenes]NPU64583.1 hypothetical protein [Bradyrhizobium aeschynomenes]